MGSLWCLSAFTKINIHLCALVLNHLIRLLLLLAICSRWHLLSHLLLLISNTLTLITLMTLILVLNWVIVGAKSVEVLLKLIYLVHQGCSRIHLFIVFEDLLAILLVIELKVYQAIFIPIINDLRTLFVRKYSLVLKILLLFICVNAWECTIICHSLTAFHHPPL